MPAEIDVELLHVTKVFGSAKVVDDVSLQVRRGEFLTLVGPSGCGKTTILRMIAGFETPTSGRILLGGQDVAGLPPYKRNVHTVFQQYALFPHRTVFGNVAFGLERRGLSDTDIKKKVVTALDLVQLKGFEYRYPQQLSGGQQQRVAIARAIILEPRVLLLDEPFSALDLKLRKEMEVELKKLQRQLGISFIFVTHDQEEALAMSDRIAVIQLGQIEQLGTGQEIYEKPRTEFVANFIGMSNILTAEVMKAETGWARLRFGINELVITASDMSSATFQTLRQSDQVRIAVRPEKIRISAIDDGALISGVIEEWIYLGDSTRWRVRLKDGTIVTVFEQNQSSTGDILRYFIGQTVYLSWDEHNSIIFDGDDRQ